jgi:imidazolonepropionase-like amidohydrolase
VLGTDAGIEPIKPHSIGPNAFVQLAQFGMPALGVLRSVTSETAKAVRLSGRKGVLRGGAG